MIPERENRRVRGLRALAGMDKCGAGAFLLSHMQVCWLRRVLVAVLVLSLFELFENTPAAPSTSDVSMCSHLRW
jgi:hypothetical protein